ncbi:MAG TPA: hypothetical protein QF753_01195 [Victivallales bacterium]|nr:hypothetical protein [Victivallales bacterium]
MNKAILYIIIFTAISFTSCNTPNASFENDDKKDKLKDGIYKKSIPIASSPKADKSIAQNKVKSLKTKHKIKLSQKEIDALFNKKQKTKEKEKVELPFYHYFLNKNKNANRINHVTISLNAAPIEEVVPIFGQLLDFNFYIDPKIKGVVSMSLDSDIQQKTLWEIFQQILWLTGSYASLNNEVVNILPFDKMAKERNIIFNPKSNVSVVLFNLKNAKSKSIATQLKPFITEGSVLIEIESQNAVLVVDAPDNIEKLKKIVKILDKKYKISWPKTVIKCVNVPPSKIAEELVKIMPILGFPVTHIEKKNKPEEPGTINIEGIDRIGLIVASAANNEALLEVKRWINILDRTNIGEQNQVYIYKVRNSKAEQLIQGLSVIFNVKGETLKAKQKKIQNSTSGSYSSGNNDLSSVFGKEGSTNSNQNSNSTFGTVATAYEISKINSENSNQNSSGNIDKSSDSGKKDKYPVSLFDVPTKIFADGANERLIIRTTPRVYSMIKALLERIDTIPEQVLIKLVVADVELDAHTQFGLQIQGQFQVEGAQYKWGTDYGYAESGGGFEFFQYGLSDGVNQNIKGYVKALQETQKLTILASPEIVTQNHSNAMIAVAETIPIQTSGVNTNGSNIPDDDTNDTDRTDLTNAYDYKDVGLILKLTPHITRGGIIKIDMDHLLSNEKPNSRFSYLPTITQRRMSTTLNIPNKGTVIIGGMIKNTNQDQLSTVPFLGNVPILNRLFGDTQITKKRTELILMVSGEIIKKTTSLEKLLVRYKNASKLLTEAYSKENINNNIILEASSKNKIILR